MVDIRTLAFYLPQFHRTPENDAWWGPGFTEWTNVTKAAPRFDGHRQPRLPADLGFYDLRVRAARLEQGRLARDHGVEGFVYYHYWFNGRRMLSEPFDAFLADPEDPTPFALCWANEDWRANWDGRSGEVLLSQSYSEEDDVEHARFLVPALRDERCVRVDGRPLFLVYRAGLLPSPRETTERWRRVWREAGVGEVHLCLVESMERLPGSPRDHGFDASVEFAPDWENAGEGHLRGGVEVHEYAELAGRMLAKPVPGHRRHSGVTPGFDNTPRRPRAGYAFTGSSPEAYGRWLEDTLRRDVAVARDRGEREVLVFVNAWNEWAEGAVLEPCALFGRGFLEAHRAAVSRVAAAAVQDDPAALSVLPRPRAGEEALTLATVCTDDPQAAAHRLRLAAAGVHHRGEVQLVVALAGRGADGASSCGAQDVELVPVASAAVTDPELFWEAATARSRGGITVLVSPDVSTPSGWLDPALRALAVPGCDVVMLDLRRTPLDQPAPSAATDSLRGVGLAVRTAALRSGIFGAPQLAESSAHV